MVSIDNLTISHVLYKFDKDDVTMDFLEHNNTIYTEDNIINYLAKPIKCEDSDKRIGLSKKLYDTNNNNTKTSILVITME